MWVPTPILSLFVFALGAVLGSFGNVLILRVPEGKSIGGRSHCPRCNRALGFIEMIPVFGYLILGGHCRGCRKPISLQYPLVEAVSGILFLLAYWHDGLSAWSIVLAAILWLLLLIAVCDMRSQMIPDVFNIPLLVLGFAYGMGTETVIDALMAAAIPALFFGFQWLVSRGGWVGSGDIILGAGIGAAVGFWGLSLVALGVAYITGAVVALYLLARKKVTANTRVAFGPFLVLGGMVALLFGERILEAVW